MSQEKPFANITVRLEREFLNRLEHLEAATRLSRSEITRQGLDAALRQFETTGKLAFPFEIGDVPRSTYEQIIERVGLMKATMEKMEERAAKLEQRQMEREGQFNELQARLLAEQTRGMNLYMENRDLHTLSQERGEELRQRKRQVEDLLQEILPLLEKVEEEHLDFDTKRLRRIIGAFKPSE